MPKNFNVDYLFVSNQKRFAGIREINEINKNILEFLKSDDKLSSYQKEGSYYRGYSKKTKIKTKA